MWQSVITPALAERFKQKPDGVPTFDQGGSEVISYAWAQRESKKGEDAFIVSVADDQQQRSVFAIFDGHSGRKTAHICAAIVGERLQALPSPTSPKAITDLLWEIDEQLGVREKVLDGATATIMLTEPAEAGKLKCTFAWMGDSSAVVTDAAVGSVYFATESHTAGPDHQERGLWRGEKARLDGFMAIRKAIEKQEGIDTQTTEVTAGMVRAAEVNMVSRRTAPMTEEEVELLVKAFRRGKLIYETIERNNKYRKNCFVRQRDRSHDQNQVWVVSTATKREEPGYTDLQMTRSMCDWKGPDLVLPEAQVHSFEVPADAVFRVTLASDGLWDVVRFAHAATLMAHTKTLSTVAKTLLHIPEHEYLTERGHEMMDDDTTILVIELNPSAREFTPLPPQKGRDCRVM